MMAANQTNNQLLKRKRSCAKSKADSKRIKPSIKRKLINLTSQMNRHSKMAWLWKEKEPIQSLLLSLVFVLLFG